MNFESWVWIFMSSQSETRSHEAVLLIVGMFGMTIWYAWPQIAYSMFIIYDIGLMYFPSLIDPVLKIFPGLQ